MFEVRIKNFQSLADASIKVDGFTALTGPNNSGKSALIRAVLGLFSNAPARFVRTGAKFAEVTIAYDDGNAITWRKGKGVNFYAVNGKEIGLVGRGVPDEVAAVGVRAVEVGNNKFWPQIASQGTGQVFLLDASGAVVAEAVADVERVGVLNKALSLAEKDKRKLASTLKIREEDEEKVRDELSRFDGLDNLQQRMQALSELRIEAGEVRQQYSELCKVREGLTAARTLSASLAGIDSVFCPGPQAVDKLRRIRAAVGELEAVSRDLKQNKTLLASLEGSESVELPPDTLIPEIETTLEDLREMETLSEAWKKNETLLSSLPEVDPVELADAKLRKILDFISGLTRLRDDIAQQQRTLEDLAGFNPEAVSLGSIDRLRACEKAIDMLQGFKDKLDRAGEQVQQADREAGRLEKKRQRILGEMAEVLGEFEMCPLCGASTEGSHEH